MKKTNIFLSAITFLVVNNSPVCYAQTSTGKPKTQATQTQTVVAQPDHPAAALPTVSKADFLEKTGQLNQLISSDRTNDAHAKWEEIYKLMNDEMAFTEARMMHAQRDKNEKAIANYKKAAMTKSQLFSNIVEISVDLNHNKNKVNAMLADFATQISTN